MDQKNYDDLELARILLKGLHDTMVSIESVDVSQVVPITTLVVFETVIEKIQILLGGIKD